METTQQQQRINNGAMVAAQKEKDVMEYVPFGAEDKIKLTVNIVSDMVCVPTKSGKKCSDKEAIKFMMLCRSRGLNPFEGDAFLLGYDSKDGPTFSLITAHQAFLKRAELHPEYDGMASGVFVRTANGDILDREGDYFDDNETLLGGWAVVFFKNRKHPLKRRLKLGTFHKGYGRWQVDPAGMIVKCAEADALRSSFPTKLGGMYLRDEMPDVPTLSGTIDVPSEPVRVSAKAKLSKQDETPAPTPAAPSEPEKPEPPQESDMTEETELAIRDEMIRTGMDQNWLNKKVKDEGFKKFAAISETFASGIVAELRKMPDRDLSGE